jgi:hypothetical protein
MKDLLAEPSYLKREKMILDAFKANEVPSWFFQFRPVRVSAVIDGKERVLEYEVSPDYVSLGNDEDYFRVPMFPDTAQAVADEVDAILPSKRMVDVIYVKSNAKLVPIKLSNAGSQMDTSLHEVAIQQQMRAMGYPSGISIAGHKKDIVIGPGLDGSKVAIYGWHDLTNPLADNDPDRKKIAFELPGVSLDAKRIQDYSTIHSSQFKDYSHGTRLIKRSAFLDGEPIDIQKVFTDPKLSVLVSDQGPFVPRFPNKKGGYASSFAQSNPDPVATVEKVLEGLGYDLGLGTAEAKKKTQEAIADFQRRSGIAPTGSINEMTFSEISKIALSNAEASEPFYKNPWFTAAGVGVLGGTLAYAAYKMSKRNP